MKRNIITIIRLYHTNEIHAIYLHPTKMAAKKQLKIDCWVDSPDFKYSIHNLTSNILTTFSKEILENA